LNRGSDIARQSLPHTLTQIAQALHSPVSTTGFFHSAFGVFTAISPLEFKTADLLHTFPHTPHSTQRLGLITCLCLTVPSIACTGQFFAQRVHPMQSSEIK